MTAISIPSDMKEAGVTAKTMAAIAKAAGKPEAELLDDVRDAVESIGVVDADAIIEYLNPGENPTPAPATRHVPKAGGLAEQAAQKPAGFSLSSYIKQMTDAQSERLLDPGRYEVRIEDVKIGSEFNDIGLRYGVFELAAIGHPDADTVPMFAAVEISDEFKTATGELDPNTLDPTVMSRFLSGLKVIEKLVSITDVTAEELGEAENAEDAMSLFIGAKFKAVISRGKDRDGIPSNKVKKIVGPVSND